YILSFNVYLVLYFVFYAYCWFFVLIVNGLWLTRIVNIFKNLHLVQSSEQKIWTKVRLQIRGCTTRMNSKRMIQRGKSVSASQQTSDTCGVSGAIFSAR
ncbi:hypothetical protein AB3X30_06075, partial [Raoultella terrigena]|uniref:hypothetical protein n=1 Tax=Raoultella terrigena TaxID=577 RepID=UPI00349FB2CC